jgi:D-alanyl-D-alanine carboxypeptidase
VTDQVGDISGTVGTLEKLAKTDPELLAKYSKVFFLSENYAPERVVSIDTEFLYHEQNPETIHALVWPKLEDLLEDAKDDSIELYVLSAYRSFDEQRALKGAYTVTYGAGSANTFSADQGYSEHQLGTTVDFITTGLNGQLAGFQNTAAYQWLLNNAYKHGFILSYPQGNGHYIFEPWHWRFVGEELARELHQSGKNFYDLDQREIDEYLADIFE